MAKPNIEELEFKTQLVKEMKKEFQQKVLEEHFNLNQDVSEAIASLALYSDFVKKMFAALKNKQEIEIHYIKIKNYQNNMCTLVLHGKEETLDYETFYYACLLAINFFKEIYPLGTVIKIKKLIESDQDALFIITNRFLVNEKLNEVVTYELVPYPFGTIDQSIEGKLFTSEMAFDEVMFKGYETLEEYL